MMDHEKNEFIADSILDAEDRAAWEESRNIDLGLPVRCVSTVEMRAAWAAERAEVEREWVRPVVEYEREKLRAVAEHALAVEATGHCEICNDTYIVAVAGPDENGQYDTDDCPCQTEDAA